MLRAAKRRLAPVLTHKDPPSCMRVSEKANLPGISVNKGKKRKGRSVIPQPFPEVLEAARYCSPV